MSIEISEAVLNYSLVSLAVMGVITLGFLAKLFYDCSKLAQNANKTTEIVNSELKPTLDELNTALKSFNNIVKNTGDGVDSVKLGLTNIVAKTKLFSGNLMSGFLKGFLAVYGLFGKKK
jgi:predicted PurR-regulated permease PerM